MPDGPIETQRLTLVPASLADTARLVELDTDPDVMRFINGGRPTPLPDIERRIRECDGFLYVATDRSAEEFVGWFSIRPSSPADRELGYRLRRDHWGRGLATEGAIAMIGVAFDDPLVNRVWAQTMTANVGSRRVIERCGLRLVRTFFDEWPGGPIDGSDLGDVECELRRGDWRPIAT